MSAEVQDRHRRVAEALYPLPDGPYALGSKLGEEASKQKDLAEVYAQALADVEDLNGYDLTACRAAYALVCEAVTPGIGPGGAAAVAMSVQLLRRRAEIAEAEVQRLTAELAEDEMAGEFEAEDWSDDEKAARKYSDKKYGTYVALPTQDAACYAFLAGCKHVRAIGDEENDGPGDMVCKAHDREGCQECWELESAENAKEASD